MQDSTLEDVIAKPGVGRWDEHSNAEYGLKKKK